jgi:gliding motility-associated-like protein
VIYNQSPWDSSFNAGVYPVQLTVTNAQGCQDTITYNVVVYDELTFPNVITPNGDLSNDYLEIEALKPNSELSILNRWGNVVYKSTNYQNDWNGKDQQGVDLKEGVYTVIFISSENKLFHFYVHLIR